MTISSFAYKLDWPRAQARWDAYWDLAPMDRPCLCLRAPRPDGRQVALPPVRSDEDRWVDPEYILTAALNYLEMYHHCGETPPAAPYPMVGTTMGYGDNLFFHPGGIALRPSMASLEGPLGWHPGPEDPWRAKVTAICNRLLDEARGRFLVPVPAQFEHLDLLSMLRGDELMLELVTDPELCAARLREIRALSYENATYLQGLVDSRQGDAGYLSWTNIWSRKPFRCAQADAAAMISPAMFERFVLPELDWQAERYGSLHYHFCGYKQHLEPCLSRSYIKVIQYSRYPKDPPQGPAHLDFYRRVQQAGRALDLEVPAEQLEFFIRHLRPEGLVLSALVGSLAEAEAVLDAAAGWAGSHAHRN